MANLFINIPVPPGNGSGAIVDVSLMGASKTFSVAGIFVASVTIEVSNEAAPTQWAPVCTFNRPDGIVLDIAARWLRATVIGYKSGAPVANVGGSDDGTLFASLPVPAGNGAGPAVDTSLLPGYKTVTVGGPFNGNVQLEVSEDGIANWSQLGFGFANPGQQSQVMTANWMRAVRSGVPLIAPGLPIIDVGACPTGGGGVGPPGPPGLAVPLCFIYRPGSGLAGPAVYDDWAALYAAMQLQRASSNGTGCYAIEFDNFFMTPVVPAGAWDMDMTAWTTVHGQQGGIFGTVYEAVVADGAVVTNLHTIYGLTVRRDDGGAAACILLDLANPLTLIGGAGLIGGSTAPLCATTDGGQINVGENCYIGTVGGEHAPAVVSTAGTAGLLVFLTGVSGGNFSDNAAGLNIREFALSDDGGLGPVAINAQDSSSTYWPFQIYLTNVPAIYQSCPMWSWFGDPNGFVASVISGFYKLIDATTGTQWRNTGGTVWVVDSSAGGSNVFTFRPGSGLAGPSVFDDFNSLYLAFDTARSAAQVSGKFKIVFDDQIVGFGNTVLIDSGPGNITYDFQYAELIGVHEDANVVTEWKDGGGEGDSLDVVNALWWEGLTATCTGQNFLMAAAANQTYTLTRTTWTCGAERMLFVGGLTTTIHLNDESQILRSGVFPAGVAPVQLNGATVIVHVNGANARVNANAFISGGAASLQAIINSSSARFDFDQADVGGVTGTMSTAAGYWTTGLPFVSASPNGLLTATEGTLVMDERTGITWRNNNGATGWSQADVSPFALPEQWAVENVPSATASTPMSCQVSTNFDDIKVMRAGSIVGIRTRLTEAVTANNVQVEVTINGVNVPATNVTMGVGSTGGVTLIAPGVVPYVAGDLIGIAFFSAVGFTPITTDLEAWLEVTESF